MKAVHKFLLACFGLVLIPGNAVSQKRIQRGAMSYVVGRGCTFLTYYVRDNYFRFQMNSKDIASASSTTPATMNWVTWVYDVCVKNYVPLELVHGLINCGKANALYAVNPPQWVLDNLRPDFSKIPGVLGK